MAALSIRATTTSDAMESAREKPGGDDHDAGDDGADEPVEVGEDVPVGALDVEGTPVGLGQRQRWRPR